MKKIVCFLIALTLTLSAVSALAEATPQERLAQAMETGVIDAEFFMTQLKNNPYGVVNVASKLATSRVSVQLDCEALMSVLKKGYSIELHGSCLRVYRPDKPMKEEFQAADVQLYELNSQDGQKICSVTYMAGSESQLAVTERNILLLQLNAAVEYNPGLGYRAVLSYGQYRGASKAANTGTSTDSQPQPQPQPQPQQRGLGKTIKGPKGSPNNTNLTSQGFDSQGKSGGDGDQQNSALTSTWLGE